MAIEDLKQSPMMAHLVNTLESGSTIQHYGRLVFAMVARHFLDEEEVLRYLAMDPESNPEEARQLYRQVNARDYNPPKRERILEWMNRQEFPICPDAGDAQQCNVYRDLDFPESVYEKIAQYYEHSVP